VNRRTFLAAAGATVTAAAATDMPIIDTHIHLFDTTRPQGVPWPAKDNAVLYKPALPERYRKLTAGLGITGAIEVEASPWVEDNQWVLDVAAKDTILVGTVGDLEPGSPDFAKQLERFHKNPLFRGIRYGNLWGRKFAEEAAKPAFVADLKRLAAAGLVMDTANPDTALVETVVRITDKVPELRVVVDHLPQLNPPADAGARRAYEGNLRELGKRSQVYVKLSQIFQKTNGKTIEDFAYYRPRLDEVYGVFGEDRVLYGSDWPNSDLWVPYDKVLGLVRDYFAAKSRAAQEKYFWKNSVAAYRWVKRDGAQPDPRNRL
jgi:predicted TIM-barrel fold metal-dependent hydrolase